MQGWLILDKPEDISSAQALNQIKRYVKPHKIGHAGTLDPFASGVLLVAIGKATRLMEYAVTKNKTYFFTIKWGQDTDTCDRTGKVINESSVIPKLQDLQKAIEGFGSGMIKQTPPQYSAISINGRRAYQIARSGEKVDIPEREVFLEKIEILSHESDKTIFNLKCGKGFYVRSIARDIASSLGVCGHVFELRRLAIEKFSHNDAIKLDYLKKILHNAESSDCLSQFLKPSHAVLDDILVMQVGKLEELKLLNGQSLKISMDSAEDVAVFSEENKNLVAICRSSGCEVIPHKVFKN